MSLLFKLILVNELAGLSRHFFMDNGQIEDIQESIHHLIEAGEEMVRTSLIHSDGIEKNALSLAELWGDVFWIKNKIGAIYYGLWVLGFLLGLDILLRIVGLFK